MRLTYTSDSLAQAQSIVRLGITQAVCVPLTLGPSVAGYLYLDHRGSSGGLADESGEFIIGLGRMASLARRPGWRDRMFIDRSSSLARRAGTDDCLVSRRLVSRRLMRRRLSLISSSVPGYTYRHPTTLDEELFFKECRMTRGRSSGPGGQHRNKVATAVFLHHVPTGIDAQAAESRQPERNRQMAMHRLRVRLAQQHRVGVPLPGYAPSELLRSRTRGGRLALNPEHWDAPAVLAEVLDVLAAVHDDLAKAAPLLDLTGSQIVKLLKEFPPALKDLNERRRQRGKPALQ